MARKTAAIKQVIASLQTRIREHEQKIADERAKDFPDEGRVKHWRQEIQGWQERIKKLEARLERRRKRGRG